MSNQRQLPAKPYWIALSMIVMIIVITYFAFKPGVPFQTGYRVEANFKSSNGLRSGSPVRIAGVDVGKVIAVDNGPGTTTKVTMKIEDDARPIHEDATARIRPRVFLEGGFMVELSQGSPSAGEMADNGTIPLSRTAIPVQFHQVLTTFDSSARESLRSGLDTLAGGLGDGGADGLRTFGPQLAPLSRDLAWVGEAAQGTKPHDVSELITSLNKVQIALDKRPERLGSLTDNLAITAAAVAQKGEPLAATIREASATLQATPPALRALDASLPSLERAAGHIEPALPIAPGAFRETADVISDLGELVAPRRRATTIAALETALRDLPGLVGNLATVFPTAKPLAECLSTHVVPTLNTEVPDGDLSSGRPAWQDFAHALVGLSSASQNFDGNGHALRYEFGIGPTSLSTLTLPLLGQHVANAPSTLRSRPTRPAGGAPPLVGDKPCSEQPVPDLTAESGSAGLTAARPPRKRGGIDLGDVRRLLQPETLRKALGGAR